MSLRLVIWHLDGGHAIGRGAVWADERLLEEAEMC